MSKDQVCLDGYRTDQSVIMGMISRFGAVRNRVRKIL